MLVEPVVANDCDANKCLDALYLSTPMDCILIALQKHSLFLNMMGRFAMARKECACTIFVNRFHGLYINAAQTIQTLPAMHYLNRM